MNETITKPSIEELLEDSKFKKMLKEMAYRISNSTGVRYSSKRYLTQDLIPEGIAAAIAAYPKFDPTRASWTTYVKMYVKYAMQHYLKKYGHDFSISSRDYREHMREVNNIKVTSLHQESNELGDAWIEPSTYDVPPEETPDALIKEYVGDPDSLTAKIFKEHVFENKTYGQLSLKYKMSESSAQKIVNNILLRIRERLSNG